MKIKIGVVTALLSLSSVASQIDSIHVENDIVTFKTLPAKTSNNISCVSAERATDWSISLKHSTGRAMYASLVAAYANKSNVEVTSANDCLDVVGVESVSAFAMMSNAGSGNTSATPQGGSFKLYKGDGVTLLGSVVSVPNVSTVIYLPHGESVESREVSWFTVIQKRNSLNIAFANLDCTGPGQVQSPNLKGWSPHYNSGKYFLSTNSPSSFSAKSELAVSDGVATCYNYNTNRNWYSISEYTDPLCGSMPCQFKEN